MNEQNKYSGCFRLLIGPLFIALVLALAQVIIQPWVAEGVKRKESILEQQYLACNDAFGALLRKLERASINKRGEAVYAPNPTKEKLTAMDFNLIYCRLALFCSDNIVPNEFVRLIKAKSLKISDIGEFVLTLRKEMKIKGEEFLSSDFNYAYSTKKADKSFDKTPDKSLPDDPKQ